MIMACGVVRFSTLTGVVHRFRQLLLESSNEQLLASNPGIEGPKYHLLMSRIALPPRLCELSLN